jgi:class 3 adenylate cyclase/tetratricopeptide (TPR) repeat protein
MAGSSGSRPGKGPFHESRRNRLAGGGSAMRCARCDADNAAGMKFCGQCGAPLGSTCPSCGAANPPEHKFCGQCGRALDQPGLQELVAPRPYIPKAQSAGTVNALPGEMKQVTVLFCDIVNSTPLTERLGAEGMRDLVHAFLDASLAEVHRYGGTAPQFTGDGFMALFGAPLTHEDHVRRALLAALAIQRGLHDTGTTAGSGLYDFEVRIGIHTGPVVFGPVADNLSMDYTVIGDTANVAARLQQIAEPGTILLSEATQLLAEGYARVEPVGPLILKGKAEPIPAYRLLSVSHRRSGLRESPSPRTAIFVDRESELAILNNFLRQVENGHGQAVGMVGEPGIGKSRLLAEFRRQVADGRASWVEGRCLSYGTAIPYLLALDLLRSNCGIAETDAPDIVAEKVYASLGEVGMDPDEEGPVLLHLLEVKDVADSPTLSNPEAVKSKAFETLRQLTVKRSVQRPLILILEDLHWVDKISEEFLGFLAESVRDARVLLLATYRPGYRPPWIDKSYAGQTPLQPLSPDDSLRMVRSVLRVEQLVDLVTQEIVAKADGNPFFLEQLALHAGEARDLRTDLMVPNTIHDVVMARIDRLPEQTKRALQMAAVIGREFPLRLLSAVWRDPGSLEDHLRELARLEFVYERVETEGSVYVFRHALTQETAYGSLLERHRRVYHGAVGRALEELYSGRVDEVAELLALHFGRSNEAEKSVDYAILAGEKSQRRWANNEALTYFNDALHRLDLLPDTEANRLRRIDAVIKQAEVKFALGQHAEHIEALDQIADLVDQADNPRRRATWHYWRGFLGTLTGTQPDIAIDHCNVAARLAADAGLDEIKADAESCLAQIYLFTGRLREATETGEQALASFEALGNLWWACRTIWHLNPAAMALGEWDASFSYCRRALQYGEVLGDLRIKVVGLWRMGATCVYQGDSKRGVEYCDEALALGAMPFDARMAKAVRGYGKVKLGQLDDGIADLSESVAWFEKSRLRYTHARYTLLLVEGYLRRGDRSHARPLIEGVIETSRNLGYLHFEGVACWVMGECLAPEAPASAEPYIETAMDILGRIGARNDLARAMVTRAALRQAAGDLATARELLEQAAAIFHELGTLDEPRRVEASRAALNRGSPVGFLGTSAEKR